MTKKSALVSDFHNVRNRCVNSLFVPPLFFSIFYHVPMWPVAYRKTSSCVTCVVTHCTLVTCIHTFTPNKDPVQNELKDSSN